MLLLSGMCALGMLLLLACALSLGVLLLAGAGDGDHYGARDSDR
jgi:hypothetical protein